LCRCGQMVSVRWVVGVVVGEACGGNVSVGEEACGGSVWGGGEEGALG
jgi:hypothetical protein